MTLFYVLRGAARIGAVIAGSWVLAAVALLAVLWVTYHVPGVLVLGAVAVLAIWLDRRTSPYRNNNRR